MVGLWLGILEWACVIYKFLGLSNQVLAVLVLWTCTAYFRSKKQNPWFIALPTLFLTTMCISYFVSAPYTSGGLKLPQETELAIGVADALCGYILLLKTSPPPAVDRATRFTPNAESGYNSSCSS